MDEASERLAGIVHDKKTYSGLVEGLVAQGLFQLLEPEVTILCKKEDLALVSHW